MNQEMNKTDEMMGSEWIRDQTREQTDTVVGLMHRRLCQLQEARACGDAELAERAGQALFGVLLMTGSSSRGAQKRVQDLLERIDTSSPEALIPAYWPKNVTIFQLMDRWLKSLGQQHCDGTNIGLMETRWRLLGTLLACGLSSEAAVAQVHFLEQNAVDVWWSEQRCASALIRYAIRRALE